MDFGSLFPRFDFGDVVGRTLVNEIVEPVGEEQMRVPTPRNERGLRRVVVGEIVLGNGDGFALRKVAEVLVFEGVRVVFRMSRDKNLFSLLGGNGVDARLLGGGEDFQILDLFDILAKYRRVAGLGHHEYIVEATEENGAFVIEGMGEDAEHLGGHEVFLNAVMVVKPCLRPPTDVKGTVDVGLAPLHDFAEFGPVIHFLEGDMFDGRARDDHAVEFLVFDLIEGLIEGEQVFFRDVFGLMGARMNELHFDLQGGIPEKSGKLRFRFDLFWHKIENEYTQRTDILRDGAGFRHDENILVFQRLNRRQIVGNLDRHNLSPKEILEVQTSCPLSKALITLCRGEISERR